MKERRSPLLILRIFLLCAGFGWFISIVGIFMPWSFIAEQLEGLGAQNLPADPMLNYWLRMTAGAFTGIGLFFFLLAAKPRKYATMIPVAAGFLIFEGLILLLACFVLHLPLLPSIFDSGFCLLIGVGIFLACRAVHQYGLTK
jgi:hypothetical protein